MKIRRWSKIRALKKYNRQVIIDDEDADESDEFDNLIEDMSDDYLDNIIEMNERSTC